MEKKIVFMGTPNFSVPILKSLHKNGFSILAVYTQPPQKSQRGQKINKSPVQEIAEKLNIECRTPYSLKNNQKELISLHNEKKLLTSNSFLATSFADTKIIIAIIIPVKDSIIGEALTKIILIFFVVSLRLFKYSFALFFSNISF